MTTSPTIIENPPPNEDVNGWVWYYFQVWGVNVIPAPVQDKNKPKEQHKSYWLVRWEDYQSKRITDEDQNKWINAGEYTGTARGIAIILGRIWVGQMKGKWLVGIDADNQKGVEIISRMFGCATIEELTLKGVVVEQHAEDAPNKAHFYFYSDTPFHNLPGIKTRYSGDKSKDWDELVKINQIPAIEIKCEGGGVHFGTPSKHSGGYTYKHVAGSPSVPTLCLSESEAADAITKLEDVLNEFGDSYLDYKSKTTGKTVYPSIEEMYKPDYKVYAGSNRHLECRRLGAKLLIRSNMVNQEQALFEVLQWNRLHDIPPLTDDDVTDGFYRYSIPKAKKWLAEKQQQALDGMARKSAQVKESLSKTRTSSPPPILAINTTTATEVKRPSSPLLQGYNDDYFEYLINYTSKTAVKQENTLLRQIYTTFLSSFASQLANNLSIRAPSSEGKSYPLMKTIEACGAPSNEIIVVNHITPTALIYQTGGALVDRDGKEIKDQFKQLKKEIGYARNKKDWDTLEEKKDALEKLLTDSAYRLDLSGKCFVLLEPPKEGLWDLLKAILSHDKFETRHMMTDKGSLGMATKNVILRGFPAFIFCSAKDESHWGVWEEILTRFMFTSPNMIPRKYYEGNKLIGRRFGLPSFSKRRVETFGTAEEHLLAMQCYNFLKNQIKSYYATPDSSPIWIPYLEQLTELLPYTKGADNRVAARIFQLLSVITLCKAHLRPKIIDIATGQQCVVSSLEDLREALHITQNVSGLPPHKVRFYVTTILKLYDDKIKEREELKKNSSKFQTQSNEKVFLTSTEIAEAYNKTLSPGARTYTADSITKAFLDELHNYGCIEKVQDPRTNKLQYVYYPLVDFDQEDIAAIESAQADLTKSTSSGQLGKELHFRRLLLPKNHKGFPNDWLKLQFWQDFDCRVEEPDLRVIDKNGYDIPLVTFIETYETPELNLSHFYERQGGDELGKEKSTENEINTTRQSHAIIKTINEVIQISESLPSWGKLDQLVKPDSGEGNTRGVNSSLEIKSIALSNPATSSTVVDEPLNTLSLYTPPNPAQQRQLLLVEAYEQEQQEKAKISNEAKTLQLLTEQRQKIPKELAPLYQDSVSVDTEWIDERESNDNEGERGIRRIYALSFVDWKGKEQVFHVEDYKDDSLFDRTRTMLNEAFEYWFNNYRLSFGFNSLGKGSDREVIFENAQHYNTTIQPVEEAVIGEGQSGRTYYRFKERDLKHTHIDWYRIFKNKAVHNYIFEQRYRQFSLETVSRALFDVGKYKEVDGLYATDKLSVDEQKQYVLQDSRLLSLLTTAENGNLFGAMQYIADLLELTLPKVCHSQVAQYWTTIYERMGYKVPGLVDKKNPETGEIEKVGQHSYFKTKTIVPKRCKNKGKPRIKVISYSGGRVLEPKPGFYTEVIGLDQESQYPSIGIMLNLGFETICCGHIECKDNPACQIRDTGDPEIDSASYYICNKIGDSAYKQRLMIYRAARIDAKEKDERVKDLALKILINGAYGVYGYKKFPFADTRVAEITTAYGRKMHKAMEDLAKSERYNFKIIGGDTDSLLVEWPFRGDLAIEEFCHEFKACYGIKVKPSRMWSKMLITKKKHYIYWEFGKENKPTIKGMEAAKNNMPKLTNIIFDQFVKNIGADRDFITDLRKGWQEEYPYCKKHRPELLLIEDGISKDPTEYTADTLRKRLAIHQKKGKDETIHYYAIRTDAEKQYGLDAYLDPQYIDDEIYRQKYFISPFKAMLKQLGYDVNEVFS
jgi:DNA polymerase elongation subunit (family B)